MNNNELSASIEGILLKHFGVQYLPDEEAKEITQEIANLFNLHSDKLWPPTNYRLWPQMVDDIKVEFSRNHGIPLNAAMLESAENLATKFEKYHKQLLPQWIPVSDRKPDWNTPVRCLEKINNRWIEYTAYRHNEGEGWYWCLCTDYQFDREKDEYNWYEGDDNEPQYWRELDALPEAE